MKKTEKISEGVNYTAISVGKLDNLNEYIYTSSEFNIPGKVFLGNDLKCTGTEVSMQIVPPNKGGEFIHKHTENEELYIVIKGKGEFKVDGEIFNVEEGSLVRVAPSGKRAWHNNGTENMIVIVVQTKIASLNKHGVSDGSLVNEPINWKLSHKW